MVSSSVDSYGGSPSPGSSLLSLSLSPSSEGFVVHVLTYAMLDANTVVVAVTAAVTVSVAAAEVVVLQAAAAVVAVPVAPAAAPFAAAAVTVAAVAGQYFC